MRTVLLTLLSLATGLLEVVSGQAPATDITPGGWDKSPGKSVLFFTKSAGYEHSVVKRSSDGNLSFSELILTDLGRKHGFKVVCTKDGSVFTTEKLAEFDVIVFYTSGNLLTTGTDGAPAMSEAGKSALMRAVEQGKGFVGIHPSTDSFHYTTPAGFNAEPFVRHGPRVDPYVAMLGAEFLRHGPQQIAKARVVDPQFPGCEGLSGTWELLEEWYTFKDFTPDLHVVLALETRGMRGIDYQRDLFPITWARRQGKGRVFYTGLGHREDVWTHNTFHNQLLGGIGWAAGNVNAETIPNLESATPNCQELQAEVEPKK